AAAGDGAAARHTLPRARFAYGKQLPWLRDGANQEIVLPKSFWLTREDQQMKCFVLEQPMKFHGRALLVSDAQRSQIAEGLVSLEMTGEWRISVRGPAPENRLPEQAAVAMWTLIVATPADVHRLQAWLDSRN
ncbi:hypothetical protein, partial [Xanthomonas oryzae]